MLSMQRTKRKMLCAEDVLPSRKKLRKAVLGELDIIKSNMAPSMEASLQEGCLHTTTDMWSCDHRKRSHMGITAHWVTDSDARLHSQTVGCQSFDELVEDDDDDTPMGFLCGLRLTVP